MKKVTCLNCNHRFKLTNANCDESEWYTICPKCKGSFDVDLYTNGYDVSRQIAIIWDIDDVKIVREDLKDKQAVKVLRKVYKEHDAKHGINWGIIKYWATKLYPKS